jgi:DNA mismatch endonuclease (patch repair protein)
LPRWRTVIFVDGCFWHRHGGCKYAYTPKSRLAFWRAKFRENVQRDKRVARALAELGWSTYVVWECETREPGQLTARLQKLFLRQSKGGKRRSGR